MAKKTRMPIIFLLVGRRDTRPWGDLGGRRAACLHSSQTLQLQGRVPAGLILPLKAISSMSDGRPVLAIGSVDLNAELDIMDHAERIFRIDEI